MQAHSNFKRFGSAKSETQNPRVRMVQPLDHKDTNDKRDNLDAFAHGKYEGLWV